VSSKLCDELFEFRIAGAPAEIEANSPSSWRTSCSNASGSRQRWVGQDDLEQIAPPVERHHSPETRTS
jgi:hypothetical protein